MEVVQASLFGMHVPHMCWGEVVGFATYLINRTPTRVLGFQTPHQKLQLLVSAPTLPNLEPRVFSYIAYVHIPNQSRGKLDPHTHKLYVTRDVTFHEDVSDFPCSQYPLQGETPPNHNYEYDTQIINGQVDELVGTQPLDYTQTTYRQVNNEEFDEVDHQLEKKMIKAMMINQDKGKLNRLFPHYQIVVLVNMHINIKRV